MKLIHIGKFFEAGVDWLEVHFSWFFDFITFVVTNFIQGVEDVCVGL